MPALPLGHLGPKVNKNKNKNLYILTSKFVLKNYI
jgi:hypothetical protein